MTEYAITLVTGVEPASSEDAAAGATHYTVLHVPNEADHSVLQQQQQWRPPPPPDGCVTEAQIASAAAEAEKLAVAASELRPRVFSSVPASHVAAYPGNSMSLQFVKGQEVLARWEAEVKLLEPIPPMNMRPRFISSTKRWTSIFYLAEIVGGYGLEHVTVRFLHATDPDKVYTVHKLDITLPPEKGEPDDAERKRQRKAKKKREAERQKREEDKAKALASGQPGPRPPLPLPSASASPLSTAATSG